MWKWFIGQLIKDNWFWSWVLWTYHNLSIGCDGLPFSGNSISFLLPTAAWYITIYTMFDAGEVIGGNFYLQPFMLYVMSVKV